MKRGKNDIEAELAAFKLAIGGCITCNGTKLLCGRCGDASNACSCGGVDADDTMECEDCKEKPLMKDPCRECPFRKQSAPGWLGAHESTGEIVACVSADVHFPCHLTVDYEQDNWKDKAAEAPHCVGALAFMNNTAKRSRDPEIAELQDRIGKRDDVFKNSMEMRNHHDK